MKPILLLCLSLMTINTPAQNFQIKTSNNALEFIWPDAASIPPGGDYFPHRASTDSSRLALLMNHHATLKDLLAIKRTCKQMGLYLNFRALSFDQGQRLTAIEVEYALKHGNVQVATAEKLTDSTRFGVFGSITPECYRYYVGFERR